LLAVSAPVDSVPEGPFAPDQSPDALQDVALVDDHVSAEESPPGMDGGVAVSDTVGAGSTVTVADALALPPAPVHVIENALLATIAPLAWLPELPSVPDHAPEALHVVAFVDVQLSVDTPPLGTEGGSARSETVGAGGGGGSAFTITCADVLALPPGPVHVSE